MDWLFLFKAFVLGIVEGITEFFPISSTGHLIIIGDAIHFNSNTSQVFEVVIQLGAILAVVWEYRSKITGVLQGAINDKPSQRFIINQFLAFLPAAIIGFLFIKKIKFYLFNPVSVACALIVGGLLILMIERRGVRHTRIHHIDQMMPLDALKVGFAQMLALIPGMSRSGSTIMGGLFLGLDRKVATEFSFFLAIPTMVAATAYDVFKHRALFSTDDIPVFIIGFITAFISALIAVKGLIRYISNHTFNAFAWYRIAFGAFILVSWHQGWIQW